MLKSLAFKKKYLSNGSPKKTACLKTAIWLRKACFRKNDIYKLYLFMIRLKAITYVMSNASISRAKFNFYSVRDSRVQSPEKDRKLHLLHWDYHSYIIPIHLWMSYYLWDNVWVITHYIMILSITLHNVGQYPLPLCTLLLSVALSQLKYRTQPKPQPQQNNTNTTTTWET